MTSIHAALVRLTVVPQKMGFWEVQLKHVPDFPLTGSGKVQKFAIRDKFIAGNYGEVLQ